MSKLLSIIVLSWNRLHYTKQTIECIVAKTTMPHELILVDNNSSVESGVKQYLQNVKGNANTTRIHLQFNDKNLGVAGGRNSGLVNAKGDYLMTIDDDVLLPDNYDILLAAACDKIPKLGITGINVEPVKYAISEVNGVKIRPKTVGNLGGACLCLPRRVFNSIGYYRVYGQYGLEDSDMYVRLQKMGLLSAYIEPRGTHLDEDKDKVYRKVKNRAHKKGSTQLKAFVKAKMEYEKTGKVYVPYIPYDPDSFEWCAFERFDGTISATADLRDILDKFDSTRGMNIGNRLIFLHDDPNTVGNNPQRIGKVFSIDTGYGERGVPEQDFILLKKYCDDNNIKYLVSKHQANY